MKNFTKTFLVGLILCLFSVTTSAHDFEVDGIYYNILSGTGKNVAVTYQGTSFSSVAYTGSITIPSSVVYNGTAYSVTIIGGSAFMDCSSLTSIEIPNSVKSIGLGAFEGCSSLTSIEIPNSVTSIESGAFIGCSSLTSIEIPNSVKSIGLGAFRGCSSLTSIEIPNSVTSIGDNVFYNCSSLTSIEIPNSVTSIGEWTFYNCSSLTSVVIGNSVTSIGDNVFYNCSSLTNIEIPNSVASIGNDAFDGCTKLPTENNIRYADKWAVEVSDRASTSYTLRSNTVGIADNTFSYCSSLTSIEIGNSLTSIGDNAFSGCSSLTNIEIPNSLTSIGYSAFRNCSSLISIAIPNNVTSIGYCAFLNCSGLENIVVDEFNTKYDSRNNCNAIIETEKNNLILGCKNTKIPNGVTSIVESAFSNCHELANIDIPNSVISIEEGAFFGCEGLPTENGIRYADKWAIEVTNKQLSSYDLRSNTIGIANRTFRGCENLKSINIPNSVRSIGDQAFESCKNLTEMVIPDGVVSLGKYAFQSCINLVSVKLPNSITSIGDNTFRCCHKLKNVNVPNKLTSIVEGMFHECQNLYFIDIPNSVTTIEEGAFRFCYKLHSLTIPDNVTSIGRLAFSDCEGLRSLTIPTSVKTIGDGIISGCGYVSVFCLNPTPPVWDYKSYSTGINDRCKLYVPASSLQTYASTKPWSYFTSIEALPTEITLTDGEAYNNSMEEEYGKITYTRTLPNLLWNCLYVPFEVPYEDLADDYDVAYINNMNSYDTDDDGEIDKLTMEWIKIKQGTLKANYPYLIKAKNEGAKDMTIVQENAILYPAESTTLDCNSIYTNFEITGTYQQISEADMKGRLAISLNGIWEPSTGLKANRFYLTITERGDAPVKITEAALSRISNIIIGDDSATGIEDAVQDVTKQSGATYDLSGRRVQNPAKGGVYIVNGKKVVF